MLEFPRQVLELSMSGARDKGAPKATCGFRHGRVTTILIWGPVWWSFLILLGLVDLVQKSFSYGLGTLRRPSVRPDVRLCSVFASMLSCESTENKSGPSTNLAVWFPARTQWNFPSTGLLSHLLQDLLQDQCLFFFFFFFFYLGQNFPSMFSCASTKLTSDLSRNTTAAGHLWFFLLSHLLRNYWVDSNETCLLGSPQCLVVQRWNRINSDLTVTLTFVSARFLVSLRTTGCLLNIFSQHIGVLREISGREYERITNTLFFMILSHMSCVRITDGKQSVLVLHICEKFARILHRYDKYVELFTLVTDSFDFHILTNLSHVWRICTYLSHMWKIRRNSSQVWQIRANSSYV